MEIIPLFPTPVGKFKLDRDLTEDEITFIKSLNKQPNMMNARSVNSYIFESDVLKDLHHFCLQSVISFANSVYAPANEMKLRITQSWGNYTLATQGHHSHEHPNSFISGVFYVSADKDKDKIHFNKLKYEMIIPESFQFNQFNSRTWWFPVNTGDLFLFPSSLNHYVESVVGEERISIAFNTFPVGVVGSELGLTELKL